MAMAEAVLSAREVLGRGVAPSKGRPRAGLQKSSFRDRGAEQTPGRDCVLGQQLCVCVQTASEPPLRGALLLGCVLGLASLLAPVLPGLPPLPGLPWLIAWLAWLPSLYALLRAALFLVVGGVVASMPARMAARWLAAEPSLKASPWMLEGLPPASRPEGLQACKALDAGNARIDGAVLLTGATGFVGGCILYSLLARAEHLGITKIVLLVRSRRGSTLAERIHKLREKAMFDELRDTFDKLVVGLEGDTSKQNFGWGKAQVSWPHMEPLRAVLHCAGDVRFTQPMQQAAICLISATLQMQQLASQWKAARFVFVSTAFVHATPPCKANLAERLVELQEFDAMELYRDALRQGSWAQNAMKALGFPNTYAFCKAVAEHLVMAGDDEGLDVRIVRPSIVGPAWAFPYIGWAGDKPSTVVGGLALLGRRGLLGGLQVFQDAFSHPSPVVPVDLVAEEAVKALAGGGVRRIVHACLDSSEADKMFSFKSLQRHYYQLLALKGSLTLPELGFKAKLLRWSDHASVFQVIHALLHLLPSKLSVTCCVCLQWILACLGVTSRLLDNLVKSSQCSQSCSELPRLYQPFSSPRRPWHFCSSLRLPEDWCIHEYLLICARAGHAFAESAGLHGPGRSYAKEFAELQIFSPSTLWADAVVTLAHPKASIFQALVAFLVRRGLSWINLTVAMDGASLHSFTKISTPLVLCPQHRSMLDFVIVGLTCFQMQPMLPMLQLPHVAADAEFFALPVLGRVLAWLGAFRVQRNRHGQPDPALRASVDQALRSGRPLEIYLEGGGLEWRFE